jgi:hypothetical protein
MPEDNSNQRRGLRRAADRDLDEALALFASQLVSVLKDSSLSLSDRNARAAELLAMLKDGRDLVMAQRWAEDLKAAILMNPRLLDLAPGLSATHKSGAAAARVMKALTPDKRTQSEKRREEALRKAANHGPGSLPSFYKDVPQG